MARALVAPATHLNHSRPFGETLALTARHVVEEISRAWIWLQSQKAARLSSKRLHVIETVSLGEKRSVAVLQIDNQQFLVSSSPTGVTLLASLDVSKSFGDVLKQAPGPPKALSKPRIRKSKRSVGVAA
jgi:hypothetical protein